MMFLYRLKRFCFLAAAFFWCVAAGTPGPEEVPQGTREVQVQVDAVRGDFLKARKRAVAQAMRTALEEELRERMGDGEFEAHRKELKRMLARADRYVKTYRFLEAVDDLEEGVSQVRLEITLYSDAIQRRLGTLGMVARRSGKNQILILINENSLTAPSGASLWDTVPISETALSQNFIEAGIEVVGREALGDLVPPETVLDAARGNIVAAVDVGLKSGADIVIVGNALSKLLEREASEGIKTIQATLSIKAVSATTGAVIAAKTNFSTVTNRETLAGELDAFGRASRKLTEFLLPSFRRFWGVGSETVTKAEPGPAGKPQVPSLPMNDL